MIRMLCFTLAGVLIAAPLVAQQAAPAGDARKGAQAYREQGCSACHGTAAQGGAWQGPALAPEVLPYTLFLRQLRKPANAMPRYDESMLSDAEAANIHAWLRSIPRGKTAAQIPILNR